LNESLNFCFAINFIFRFLKISAMVILRLFSYLIPI